MSRRRISGWVDVFIGVATVFVGHVLAWFVLYILALMATQIRTTSDAIAWVINWMSVLPFYAVIGIGLTQLLYVIPLCLRLKARRHFNMMKGVIIGAVITLLLNGSCFIYFMSIW